MVAVYTLTCSLDGLSSLSLAATLCLGFALAEWSSSGLNRRARDQWREVEMVIAPRWSLIQTYDSHCTLACESIWIW